MATYLTPALFVADTDGAWCAVCGTGKTGKSMYKSKNMGMIR